MIIGGPSRRLSSATAANVVTLLTPWTLGSLSHALLQALLRLTHVLFKLIALKFSMRSNNEAFRISILRRRQELGRILNFKCL